MFCGAGIGVGRGCEGECVWLGGGAVVVWVEVAWCVVCVRVRVGVCEGVCRCVCMLPVHPPPQHVCEISFYLSTVCWA